MRLLRCVAIYAALACVAARAEWPGFRGDGSSNAPNSKPPATWSLESGENVAWTAELPGRGVSGPIVVGGRVLLTASDGPRRERLHVLAFDASSGAALWSRRMWATGRPNCHPTSANAAPTPCSDGERVFVFYSSNDLAAFTLDGDLAWVRGLALDHRGVGNDIGMASSPTVAGDAVVVQAECQGDSFAIAVDRRTGETLWETPRLKESNWASPLPWVTADGEFGVWLQDREGVKLYAAKDGKILATIKASTAGVPSPASIGDRLVLAASGVSVYHAPLTDDSIPAMQAGQLQPGSPTPVVTEDRVLVVNRGGVLACADLETGDVQWRRRLGGQFWATPVVAGGSVYCVNASGEATVVSLDDGKVISEAEFGEDVLGSPAVSGDAVYFRSHEHLWKIATVNQALRPNKRADRAQLR